MKSEVETEGQIDTPSLIIDEAIALDNIRRFQDHCKAAGLKLRPHIKTHKSVRFARQQLDAGAIGITCQKIGEAEVMARSGADDILITFNIMGESKLQRLRQLQESVSRLAVTADNHAVAAGLSETFASAPQALAVMVECDTGAGRCGVQNPEEALQLAQYIVELPGLSFAGLMTYPAPGQSKDAAKFMKRCIKLLNDAGIDCPDVSSGGTPDMWSASTEGVFTEYRIGTYIYNDRSLIERGVAAVENCAGRVHATVVSTPTPDRAVIDAGSKVLTSDLLGLSGYGLVVGHPEARIESLSEEHGVLEVSPDDGFKPGDRVQLIPNHICVVSNMFDHVWLRTVDGEILQLPVDARGMVV